MAWRAESGYHWVGPPGWTICLVYTVLLDKEKESEKRIASYELWEKGPGPCRFRGNDLGECEREYVRLTGDQTNYGAPAREPLPAPSEESDIPDYARAPV